MKKKITFILFGSTGDLAKNKIIPALNKLTYDFDLKVICVGRRNFTTKQYIDYLKQEKVQIDVNLKIKYFIVDLEKTQDIEKIPEIVDSVDKKKSDVRIFYLATSSDYFEKITKSISKCKPVPIKLLFEKPFGNDMKSFLTLEKNINLYLSENEIFRVDHYLAKETIQNILSLRLSNPFFEKTWRSEFIDEIKIVLKEDFGVKDRVEYYNKTGAIKDMLQSHLLQIASFVLMDAPEKKDSESVNIQKIKAINALNVKNLKVGQYKEYKEELKRKGLKESDTETYVEAEFESKNKRWKETKITFITGKKLEERRAYIQIIYKKDPCTLYCDLNTEPNNLTINIQPVQGVDFFMNVRTDAEKNIYKTVPLGVPVEMKFSANTKESYQKILEECINGNKESFLTVKQLEVAWRITDKILKLKKNKKLNIY